MNRKWNTESFSKKVKEIDSNYTLISEYVKSSEKVELYHSVCGKKYFVLPCNFIGGIGWCSHCAQLKRNTALTKTQEEFENEIYDLVSDEYKIVSEYSGANRKIKFQHKCGNIFEMTPSNFLQGQRCPKCFSSESRRHTKDEVQKIINTKLDENYILVSDYKNNHSTIFVEHLSCGNIWKTTLRGINGGNRCPFCTKMSKGEERILKYLNESGQDAIYQYIDERCKNKNPLPFDFYIPSKNTFIEYDGVFHYENILGKDVLERQKINDNIKNIFIEENNYKLIRIPYWDFDKIEEILNTELN